MLDVSRQTVSRWESGKSVPSSVQLSNLCKAFNIDANNLFDPDAELTADNTQTSKVYTHFSPEFMLKEAQKVDFII